MENEGMDNRTTVTNTPPMMAQQHPEFIKWQLENDGLVERLEWRLKGKIYDSDKDEYVPVSNPMLNDCGVYWVIAAVEVFTDKVFQLSNFSQEEINDMAENFEHDLVDHLFAHYNEYGLNIIADLRMIRSMVSGTVLASIKRSLNAGTYKGMSLGFQHTEVMQSSPQQRGNFWQKVLPKSI